MSDFKQKEKESFDQIKSSFLDFDPAFFIENNLTIDGSDFKIIGNGWKFMVDVYRYIGLQATQKSGKPVVIKKGRQVGATMMAAAIDLFFTNSGLFHKPPIRVLHAFPSLGQVKKFSQDKLEGFVRTSKNGFISKNKLEGNSVDNLTMKQFKSGTLWVDSIGEDGDRIRGMTVDAIFFDECFPYETYIEVEGGKIQIGEVFELFSAGLEIPLIKSYNEKLDIFEYKKIKNAWNRGERNVIEIFIDEVSIICTPEHRILTDYGWCTAINLKVGDSIISSNGFCSVKKRVTSVTTAYMKSCVYDIEVSDNHNFIVVTETNSNNQISGIVVSNCQDMFATAIGNATKTLTAAKYGPVGQGVQVYFGTPKEKNSYFSSLWDMSDQRYYHLGCKNCKETFPFYLPDDKRWMDIWVSGHTIRCPLCSCEQHKVEAIERGKWVPSRNPDECKLVGFHINQLYIPYFTKENILNLMPENNPLQTERIFKNEVVGEFFSGAGLPITRAEIYEKCRDADRAFSKTISAKEKSSYLGVDWGGKDDGSDSNVGQSYSCVVILSALPDGTLLVEHAHKLRKQDFDYKKETIHEMYKRFGIKQGLSDWFFGQDVVHDLQRHYGSRFLGAQGSGNLLKPLKFREDELIVSYNKDMMVEEIFDLFRKGKIRFPWKSFEYIEWLIDHCTSMESSIKTVGGQPIKTYSKGSGPNDGLMALMYAYMAYKFDATKGFSIKPGINGNEQSAPRPVLAHLKRRI
jgi:hypothetical protein